MTFCISSERQERRDNEAREKEEKREEEAAKRGDKFLSLFGKCVDKV